MHDDLTAQDIEMMQKELDHRKLEADARADRGGQAHTRVRRPE